MGFKKEDLILVLPPRRWKDNRYSLGLLYVSASLKQAGFDNIIIERGLFKNEIKQYDFELVKQAIINKIKILRPKMIGYTVNVQEFEQLAELNNELKKEFSFFSFVGGPQSTAKPIDFLDNGFDAAVIGEGEITAVELVKCFQEALETNQPFADIKKNVLEKLKNIAGIAYKNINNENIINPPRAYADLTNQVLPTYDKIDMESYIKIADGTVRGLPLRSALILTSRGCPYDCAFCDCNKVFGQKVRYRGLANIYQEVKLLKEKYDVEGIWLADDTFTLNREHILGVGKIMKEFKIIWSCNTRVNLLDKELIMLMKKDGCVQFDIGVESGSQRVLDEVMRKQINLAQIKNVFALCRQCGVRTLASFMMGLPGETLEEMEATRSLAKEIRANFYVLSIFTPLPGSSLFEQYYKDEIKIEDYKDLNFFVGLEKFNKSQVKNIKELNTKWRKELALQMKIQNLNQGIFFLKFFFRFKHKKERLNFMWQKIKKLF